MFEFETIVQATYYLLKKLGKAGKIKLIKLLYFADKYHLVHYGRTLTNDTYFAMENGPVGTLTKDVLSLKDSLFSTKDLEYVKKYIQNIQYPKYNLYQVATKDIEELEMLSETDIEALNFVMKAFGNKSREELSDYSHYYPEWKQYEILLKTQKRSPEFKPEELLSLLADDPIARGLTVDHIEHSREIVLGKCD